MNRVPLDRSHQNEFINMDIGVIFTPYMEYEKLDLSVQISPLRLDFRSIHVNLDPHLRALLFFFHVAWTNWRSLPNSNERGFSEHESLINVTDISRQHQK